MIEIEKYSETFLKIHCTDDVAQELCDYFTFEVPGARFIPKVRARQWDGKIRLFSTATHLCYVGLREYVEAFLKERDYEFKHISDFRDINVSEDQIKSFITALKLPLEPRQHQIDAFHHCVCKQRALILSPTSSGKSLVIYMLTRFFNKKTLIIVPTTTLIHQMFGDFKSYGFDSDKNIHLIYSGKEKDTDKQIYISTWQSIYKLPKKWFDQFGCVIGDEAHLFKAKSLVSIMTKLHMCKYRFGFTGTLDGTQTHRLVLEGLFGAVKKTASTVDLIAKNYLSQFNIKTIILRYPDSIRDQLKNCTYQQEMDFLVQYMPRNNFISNLALSLQGNTLVFYQYIEKHGELIYDLIKTNCKKDRCVFFVSGLVTGIDRNKIREIVEKQENAIIVASYGTFSTGINIRNLHNTIFASPTKSRIRNLQSIGRGLRIGDNKEKHVLFDIADDIVYTSSRGKEYPNFTYKHFIERLKIYNEEKFDYKNYSFHLGDKNAFNYQT